MRREIDGKMRDTALMDELLERAVVHDAGQHRYERLLFDPRDGAHFWHGVLFEEETVETWLHRIGSAHAHALIMRWPMTDDERHRLINLPGAEEEGSSLIA